MSTQMYDFSARLESQEGGENKEADQLGKFLGMAMANAQETGGISLMKMYTWSKELLHKDEMTLILDKEDAKKLATFVEGSRWLNLWTKGGIIDVLENGGKPVPKSGKK